MTFDKEFKEAIHYLSNSEKDKLILRLLKRDLDLASRIYFELVSSDTRESRRKQVEKDINRQIEYAKSITEHDYSSPGILLMEMRETSGYINEHVKITKDKYGEVYLHIFLLKEFLKIYRDNFKQYSEKKSYTFNIYAVARTFKIMVLLRKMHEDMLLDFEDGLKEIGELFNEIPNLMKVSINNGLNINWLKNCNIPENIAEIEKDLRQSGYLR
jgi:hypothetical protein